MNAVFYPTQDTWYIYGKVDATGDDMLIDVDIKQINNSEMGYLLKIIDNGIDIKKFLLILLETGYKNHYRANLYLNLFPIIKDEFNDINFSNVLIETKSIYEYLNK